MPNDDWLTERFAEHEPRLRALARRLLGTTSDAEDAVQEAWLRLTRSDAAAVENLGGWLTTVVSRIALDMLRTRTVRNEQHFDTVAPEAVDAAVALPPDPVEEALVADAVSSALLVVLDRLAPAERLAFVLHDVFMVPFTEIGKILGRSPAAAKQLAHRARVKAQGGSVRSGDVDLRRQQAVVDAFLDASRTGDLAGLVAVLDPGIVMQADDRAVVIGAAGRVEGADAVARVFAGRALAARPVLIDGGPGLVWRVDGAIRVAWELAVENGRVTHIEMLADPETIERLHAVQP